MLGGQLPGDFCRNFFVLILREDSEKHSRDSQRANVRDMQTVAVGSSIVNRESGPRIGRYQVALAAIQGQPYDSFM